MGAVLALQGCGRSPAPAGKSSTDSTPQAITPQNVNNRDNKSRTPLHLAIEKGAVAEAADLLAKGANVADPLEGILPLHLAAKQGSLEMVQLLISKGAGPQAVTQSDKLTPLHFSTTRPVAELLVASGTPVDIPSTWHETPLHKAAERGNAEVVEFLLEKGADPMAPGRDNALPLNYAASRRVAELLVGKGAPVNGKPDQHGRNIPPFYSAANKGHAEVVAYLLEQGADATAKNRYDATALRAAVENGHEEVVRVLFEKGIREDAQEKMAQSNGVQPTLLEAAARKGHRAVGELLLANGADVNEGRAKPLLLAAGNGDHDMLELLLSRGADVNVKESGGRTALHAAATGKPPGVVFKFINEKVSKDPKLAYADCVRLLLEKGADARVAMERSLLTPLHRAAAGNFKEAAELLLAAGADVNAADEFNATPLHWAVINNAVATAEILLKKGADPKPCISGEAALQTTRAGDMPNPFGGTAVGGQTPYMMATSQPMKDLLVKHGALEGPPAAPPPPRKVNPQPASMPPPPTTADIPDYSTSTRTTSHSSSTGPLKDRLKISAINASSAPATATINGQEVVEGGSFTDNTAQPPLRCQVIKIEKAKVILRCNGREETLYWSGISLDSFMEK